MAPPDNPSQFTGSVVPGGPQKFYSVGKVLRTADDKFQILELPVGVWTQVGLGGSGSGPGRRKLLVAGVWGT